MTPSRLISGIVFVAFISALLLVKFYIDQKEFTSKYKEFTLTLTTLQSKELQLKHDLLQNVLLSYQSLDTLAKHTKELELLYKQASDTPILRQENYQEVNKELQELSRLLQIKLANVEDQLMFNAAIRNSLVFLTTQLQHLQLSSDETLHIYKKANKILKRFTNAVITQDLDYLSKEEVFLHSDSKEAKLQEFIQTFNLHAHYLVQNFPQFIITTKYILNDNLTDAIEELKALFKEKAIADSHALDLFALIIFTIFLFSVGLIILLALQYFKENKKLHQTKESLEYSLTHDLLTKLHNRKSFIDTILSLQKPHLLLINIDNFKNVNDIYGNEVGNKVLKMLAKLLKDFLYENIYVGVYRTGGDEFGILFESIDETQALQIAHQVEKLIAAHTFSVGHLDIEINVSIASNNIAPIMENADLALKWIKKDLTNRVIAFKDSLNLKKSVKENLKIIDTIKYAIADDRIIPYFQPIINLQSAKVEKYEALVRLQLKNGELLSPYHFLETLKKTSYYYEVTKIMLHKTIITAKRYPEYRFSLNISMDDILNNSIKTMIFEEIRLNFEKKPNLDIEILESEYIHDTTKVQEFIEKLHLLGVNVLLDDFGSGYSNFSYFSHLDIDLVKIDGSIVKEIGSDNRKYHMLQSIYDFSQGLELENVAEFVETKEIAHILRGVGVKYAQGYYFGAPAPTPLLDANVKL